MEKFPPEQNCSLKTRHKQSQAQARNSDTFYTSQNPPSQALSQIHLKASLGYKILANQSKSSFFKTFCQGKKPKLSFKSSTENLDIQGLDVILVFGESEI